MANIHEIQKKAHVKLFGDKMVIHWTGLHDSWEAGFEQILDTGHLSPGTSFTTSADLPYPKDNDKPVGLVFAREDIERLGYRNLPLDSEGVTALEIAYELTGGREVPLDLLRGVVSYRPAVLRDVREIMREHRLELGDYGNLPKDVPTKLIDRPKYDTLDVPQQLADHWNLHGEYAYGKTVELPPPRRPNVRAHRRSR